MGRDEKEVFVTVVSLFSAAEERLIDEKLIRHDTSIE